MLPSLLLVSFLVQQDIRPLPELKSFLAEFRKTLHTDSLILSNYTYTEKRTSIRLDGKGKPKKTGVEVHQVFPHPEEELVYQRLISKNGVPQTPAQLAKQDREHQKKVNDFERKRKTKSPQELEKARAEAFREDEKIIDDLFAVYDIRLIGREFVGGHSAIRLKFQPRAGYKPKTREGRIMSKVAGDAWVAEADHQLARIEAEVIDTISVGFGLLARLNKGTRLAGERRKFNDEVWLPVKSEASVSVRLLMLKGFNLRETREYSDHQKFNVETKLSFPELEAK